MAASNSTPNLSLPLFVDDDRPSWLGDFNRAMNTLDTSVTEVGNTTSAAIVSINTVISSIQTQLSTVYTKTEVDQIVTTLMDNFDGILGDYLKSGDLESAITPFITSALAPYAKAVDVAPLVHTHTSSQITDLNSAVSSIINATPRGALSGPLSSRPAPSSVTPGTIYIATNVPEQYVSNGSSWIRFGGGGSFASAQIVSNFDVTATAGTWQNVTGLTASFVAGEGPVEIGLCATIQGAGLTLIAVQLDAVTLVETRREYPATTYYIDSVNIFNRKTGLVPGSTHSVRVQAAFNAGVGSLSFLASATQPATLRVDGV